MPDPVAPVTPVEPTTPAASVDVGFYDFWDDVKEPQIVPNDTAPAAPVSAPVAPAAQVATPAPPPSPNDDLARRLEAMERHLMQMSQPAAPTQPAAPPPPALDPIAEFEKLAREQNWDENYTKTTVNLFRSQQTALDNLNAELKKVAAPVQAVMQSEQQRRSQNFNTTFDSMIAKLPEDVAPVLGRNPVGQATKEEMEGRIKLIEQMNVLDAGYRALGREMPVEAIFQQAVLSLHGDDARKRASERAKVNAATMVRDRNGSFLQRAESRTPEPLSGRDAAIAAVKEMRRTFQPEPDNIDWDFGAGR